METLDVKQPGLEQSSYGVKKKQVLTHQRKKYLQKKSRKLLRKLNEIEKELKED